MQQKSPGAMPQSHFIGMHFHLHQCRPRFGPYDAVRSQPRRLLKRDDGLLGFRAVNTVRAARVVAPAFQLVLNAAHIVAL